MQERLKEPYVTWTAQAKAATLKVKAAADVLLQLEDGSTVVDLASSSFQAGFGHGYGPIVDAIKRQLEAWPVAFPKAEFARKSQATKALVDYLGLADGRVFYTVSGAESIENALKIARHYTGRPCILARRKSYHGASLGALAVTGDWRREGHLALGDLTIRIPEPSEDPTFAKTRALIEQAGKDRIAAFCLEPITGMNGVIIPPATWWRGVEAACRDFQILLIADEVTTGFGRTGPAAAYQQFGLSPDLIALAKTITGGHVPFGALWTSESIARFYDGQTLACGLTNYAHPLGLAAMEAVLKALRDPEFIKHKEKLTSALAECMRKFEAAPFVRCVRRAGLLAAVELADSFKPPTTAELWKLGTHVAVSGASMVFAPPFVMSPAQLIEAMGTLYTALERQHAGQSLEGTRTI